MAAKQEPSGRGEVKFHGRFVLFLKLARKTLSDGTQPRVPAPCLYPCDTPALSLYMDKGDSLGVKLEKRVYIKTDSQPL